MEIEKYEMVTAYFQGGFIEGKVKGNFHSFCLFRNDEKLSIGMTAEELEELKNTIEKYLELLNN